MDTSISTRNSNDRTNIDALIREGVELRCAVDALKARLDDVNRQLAEMAVFPEGRSTAWICGSEYKARVVNRVYEKWDQSLLEEARNAMGHETFALLFKQVWEPVSRRDVQGFLAHGPAEYAEKLRGALSTKVTPAVSFVTQDEKVDGHNGSGRHGAPAEARADRETREGREGRDGRGEFGLRGEARLHGGSEGHGAPRPGNAPGLRGGNEGRGEFGLHEGREGHNITPRAVGSHCERGDAREISAHPASIAHDHHAFRRERASRPRGSFSEAGGPTPFGLPHFLSRAFGSSASRS